MSDGAPQLIVTVETHGERASVALTGDLDTATADQLDSELAAVVGNGARAVELDLAGVDFIDSWGLRVLIAAQGQLAALGGRLSVVAAGDQTRRLLSITGLDELLVGPDDPPSRS